MNAEHPLGPEVTLRGIVPMTTARAQRGYRLNRFLGGFRHAEQRAAFTADAEACMAAAGLDPVERDFVRKREFSAMLDYGASIVGVAKYARAVGVNLVELGALGRGQTAAEFVAERRRANEGKPWQF